MFPLRAALALLLPLRHAGHFLSRSPQVESPAVLAPSSKTTDGLCTSKPGGLISFHLLCHAPSSTSASMSRRVLVVEQIADDIKYLPKWRRQLAVAYDIHQSQLLYELTRLAKYQLSQHPGKSWEELIQALESWSDVRSTKGNLVNFYLSQLHPSMLQAALKGQVARMFFKDENFRRMVQNYHELYPSPGTYVTIPHRIEFLPTGNTQVAQSQASLRNPWAGYGLTPHELETVCTAMKSYVKWNDPRTNAEAACIDTRFPPPSHSEAALHGRRYLRSSRAIDMILLWTVQVKRLIIEPARQTPDWDIPLPWCFSEVGFGIEQKSRAGDHHVHDGTNYLFGLVTAVMWSKFPQEFSLMSLSMNFVAKPGHTNLSETLVSIIHGSYLLKETNWFGLNPKLAGGLHIEDMSRSRYDENWKLTEERFASKQYIELHVKTEDAKWARLVEDSVAFRNLCDLRKEVSSIQDKIKQSKKTLEEKKRNQKEPESRLKSLTSMLEERLNVKEQTRRSPSLPPATSPPHSRSRAHLPPSSPSSVVAPPRSTPPLESDLDPTQDEDDTEEEREVANQDVGRDAADYLSFSQMPVRCFRHPHYGRSSRIKRTLEQDEESEQQSETAETQVQKAARLAAMSSPRVLVPGTQE